MMLIPLWIVGGSPAAAAVPSLDELVTGTEPTELGLSPLGDFDGDGLADLGACVAATEERDGAVYVYPGQTGGLEFPSAGTAHYGDAGHACVVVEQSAAFGGPTLLVATGVPVWGGAPELAGWQLQEGRLVDVGILYPAQAALSFGDQILNLGDHDGRGDPDLAVLGTEAERGAYTEIWPGEEPLGEEFPSRATWWFGEEAPRALVAMGDFGQDDPDTCARALGWIVGDGSAVVGLPCSAEGGNALDDALWSFAPALSPALAAGIAADLDGDGRDELVLGGNGAVEVWAWSAEEGPHLTWGVASDGSRPELALLGDSLAVLADLNGDGRPELAVSHDGGAMVFRSEGDGFVGGSDLALTDGALQERAIGEGSTVLNLGDADGDTQEDLLVVDPDGGTATAGGAALVGLDKPSAGCGGEGSSPCIGSPTSEWESDTWGLTQSGAGLLLAPGLLTLWGLRRRRQGA